MNTNDLDTEAHPTGSRAPALTGRVGFVVGGASGIGAAIADAFRHEGAQVVIGDRNSGAEVDGAHDAVYLDLRDEESVKTAVSQVIAMHGRIDILVNSAGVLTEVPLVDMTVDQWSETIEVDLTGVFLSCRAVLPHMIAAGGGRIINISSQLGIKGAQGLTHYSAAKAGVIGLTKALALEVAQHGILVNAIAPGPINTPLLAGISEQWKVAKCATLPLGRFGVASEIAPTAVLLASDPGGNLYVGQTLGPNSGDVMP